MRLVSHGTDCENTGKCNLCERNFSTEGPPYEEHFVDEDSKLLDGMPGTKFYCRACMKRLKKPALRRMLMLETLVTPKQEDT